MELGKACSKAITPVPLQLTHQANWLNWPGRSLRCGVGLCIHVICSCDQEDPPGGCCPHPSVWLQRSCPIPHPVSPVRGSRKRSNSQWPSIQSPWRRAKGFGPLASPSCLVLYLLALSLPERKGLWLTLEQSHTAQVNSIPVKPGSTCK